MWLYNVSLSDKVSLFVVGAWPSRSAQSWLSESWGLEIKAVIQIASNKLPHELGSMRTRHMMCCGFRAFLLLASSKRSCLGARSYLRVCAPELYWERFRKVYSVAFLSLVCWESRCGATAESGACNQKWHGFSCSFIIREISGALIEDKTHSNGAHFKHQATCSTVFDIIPKQDNQMGNH